MMVWKMIFLFRGCILSFHVNLPGCKEWKFHTFPVIHTFELSRAYQHEMTHTNFEGCLGTLRKQKVQAPSKLRDCFYVKQTHSCPKQLYKNITGAGLHVEEQTKNMWNKTRIPLFSGSEKEVDLARRSPCLSLLWSTNVIKSQPLTDLSCVIRFSVIPGWSWHVFGKTSLGSEG